MNGQQPTAPGVDVSATDGATTLATTAVPSHDHAPGVPCDCDRTCGEGWPYIVGVALLVLCIQRIWSWRRRKPQDPSRPTPDARGAP